MEGLIKEMKMGGLRLLIVEDSESLSQQAAEYLYDQVVEKAGSHISIATGSTPEGAYERWVSMIKENDISTENLRIHKLDEWAGVAGDDPASCEYFLQEQVIKPLGITADRYNGVSCSASDPEAECSRMADFMEKNPLDLSILGVGVEGHLALNESSDSLNYGTHYTELASSSKDHEMLDATAVSVDHGMTTGIGEIMAAERILFLLSGSKKSVVFNSFMEKQVSSKLPASMLWLHHDVTCICDKDAAAVWMDKYK